MGKKVVIFCASSNTIDPKYNQAARQLVSGLHALGYDVVSGGGARGTSTVPSPANPFAWAAGILPYCRVLWRDWSIRK